VKIWAYIILLGMILAAAGTAARMIYNAGKNSVILQSQEDALKAQNEAVEKRMTEWIATQEIAEVVIHVEEKIVERIRVVEREVPKIVKEFVVAECRDLGPEYAGLLNDAVYASNQRSNSGPAASSSVDDSL